MKSKLLIITGNAMKFRELSGKLEEFFDCEQRTLDGYEIQGEPEEILKHKMLRAFETFKQPVLVDDVSFHLDALNGFPGAYVKDFLAHMTPFEIGEKFKDSRVKVSCRLGFCRGEGDFVIAEGTFSGTIISAPNNDHKGQEFDLIVQIDGTDGPMINFPLEEKNEISHRGLAMKDLLKKLRQN